MKSVRELFAMQNVMINGILNQVPFVYKGEPFTREDWLDWCEEQEGVRFCQECGELMTDGYLVAGSDTYCSLECVEKSDAVTEQDLIDIKTADDWDDDNFFYTEWEEEL